MGKYIITTQNGTVLEGSNIKEIIEELSYMTEDKAIKFTFVKDNGIQILFDTMSDMIKNQSL